MKVRQQRARNRGNNGYRFRTFQSTTKRRSDHPKSGRATVATGDVNRPNGLAFSPDEKKLYIIEYGVTPLVIKVYEVNDDKLANGRTFITSESGGTPDGFRCDVDGNLWCGWGMGNAQQTGSRFSIPPASRSASSRCPNAVPTSASAAPNTTACSWPRAIRSIRSM